MSDGAISKEAMLSGMRDIRLPSEALGGIWADTSAAVCLAAFAALLCVGLLRLLARRKPRSKAPTSDMSRLSDLPEDARRIALLHLLKSRAPDRYAALRPGLYKPGAPLDIAKIEAELARHV